MNVRGLQFLLLPAGLCLCACASTAGSGGGLPPLRIEGASTFSAQRLRELVAAEVGDGISDKWARSAVDDGAFAIERFYASQGFPSARVAYEFARDPEQVERAIFNVVEGPRVALASIRIEGATSLNRKTLENLFPEVPRLLIGEADTEAELKLPGVGPPWWVESALESAAGDLEDYYYRNGFLDVRVAQPRATLDAERTHARVVIEVREGVRSKLTQVDLRGAPEHTLVALNRVAESYVQRAYSPLLAGEIRARLEESLGSQGYPEARAAVQAIEGRDDGGTAVVFEVDAGQRVSISSIEIRGAERTRSSTILALVKFSPGDFYNSEKERESFRALYQSGLFSGVSVSLESGAGAERALVVEVSEAPWVELFVEPGYGSYERFRIGLGGRHNNVFGTGRSVELETTLSELAQSGRLSVINPRFFGSDVRSTTSLFANRREEPSFTSRETGVGWNLSRRFTRRLSATLGYAFRSTSVTDVTLVGPAVQALIDAVEISSISLTPVYDTRDSVFAPSSGSVTRVTLEFADSTIGSELDFVRLRLGHSTYSPLWSGGVLALSWRAGSITPIGSSDSIPLQERFFNGGENTVRSFREDRLGPTDVFGNHLGGETFHVFSLELRQKLTGNLDCALFVDTGNVQLEASEFFDTDDFRSAYGAGLRYVLPIGPIRLDYGINPDPDTGESRAVLHFTVGMAF